MVNMLPDFISEETKSPAEKKLFYDFKNYKSDEHIVVLHSLGLAEHNHKVFGEVDFVVLCREGVLCLEVKGGSVRRENGVWYFTDRYGNENAKEEGPFQQVNGNMNSLRNRMIQHVGNNSPLVLCQYAAGVIMPDCSFWVSDNKLRDFGTDIIPEINFDKTTYKDLGDVIFVCFDYWRRQMMRKHHVECGTLTDAQIDELAMFLRGDFRFVPSMKDVIDTTYKALVTLTDEQYEVMEALADNDRTLVAGVAGTGKTLLGMEQARHAYAAGKSVLYLCFNKTIADYVAYKFKKEKADIVVKTLHALMLNGNKPEAYDTNFFEKVLPQRFMKEKTIRQFDYLIIDEGQDLLRNEYLSCINRILKGGLEDGKWLIFYDPNQNIYNQDEDMDKSIRALRSYGAVKFKLTVNCRNTKAIANATTLMTGMKSASRLKVDGPKVQPISYSNTKEEISRLEDIISELIRQGVEGSNLIILSKYKQTSPKNCLYGMQSLCDRTLKTDGAMWRAKNSEIRVSTIASFKGLESKTVIFADVDSFKHGVADMLNYVGMSRACSLLYILYKGDCEPDRQKRIQENAVKLYQRQ